MALSMARRLGAQFQGQAITISQAIALNTKAASHPSPAQRYLLLGTVAYVLGLKDAGFTITCLHCIKHFPGELDITWVMGRCFRETRRWLFEPQGVSHSISFPIFLGRRGLYTALHHRKVIRTLYCRAHRKCSRGSAAAPNGQYNSIIFSERKWVLPMQCFILL